MHNPWDGIHTWRVCAYNETETSDYTELWALEIADPPGVPALLAPENGAITATHSITFNWEAGEGEPPEGTNLELDGAAITATVPAHAAYLEFGEHTWRSRSFYLAGYSDYSAAWTLAAEGPRRTIYLPLVVRHDQGVGAGVRQPAAVATLAAGWDRRLQ